MGCGASHPTASISPAMSPAHAAKNMQPMPLKPQLVEEKQQPPAKQHLKQPEEQKETDRGESISSPADPSASILNTAIAEDAPAVHTSLGAPVQVTRSDSLSTSAAARAGKDHRGSAHQSHHHHHHHTHHRHGSVSSRASINLPATNAASSAADTPPRGSTSLIPPNAPGSTPGHTRTLSGHHRSRSFSVVQPPSTAMATVLDAGADPKDQMMANQLKRSLMAGGEGTGSGRPSVSTGGTGSHKKRESVDMGGHKKRESINGGGGVSRQPTTYTNDEKAGTEDDDDDDKADGGGEAGEGGKHHHHGGKKEKKDKEKKDKDGKKDKKEKVKIIKTLELADLQHLSGANLEMLWKQYDKDKNGTLDRSELKKLAKDCINRTIAMCEEEIRRQQPQLTENELKAAVEKELKFVLPGANEANASEKDVRKVMVKKLVRKLDVNGDGDVTKAELLATWNVFAQELFQMKVTEGPVNCSIM